MKRILCLCTLAAILLTLCACQGSTADGPGFYYLRSAETYQHGSPQPVIGQDNRDISFAGEDMRYLLQLYLEGPVSDELYSPFPEGLRLVGIIQEEDSLTISLSPEFLSLEGIELTLAGACLAKTCFSLSDVSRIRIQCDTKTWDYHRESFLFSDSNTSHPTE